MKNQNKTIQEENAMLKMLRLEIAVSICKKYPAIYSKIFRDHWYVMGEKEAIAADVLRSLCETEPSIRFILGYYY